LNIIQLDTSPPSVLLKVSEAAELVGCHPVTIRRRIADGSLPAVRIADTPRAQLRIDSGALSRFLERQAP
jgi:excisionase family DNA binding protein